MGGYHQIRLNSLEGSNFFFFQNNFMKFKNIYNGETFLYQLPLLNSGWVIKFKKLKYFSLNKF